jgi:lysyl endopeptidase
MRINRFIHNWFGSTVLQLSVSLLGALVLSDMGFAKMYEEPKSFSVQDTSLAHTSLEQVERKDLPKVDVEGLLSEDRALYNKLQRPGPLRFALAMEVVFTLDNSGTTQELPDGRLWRLRIHSPRAKSHNLGITRFDMPEGAKLWIYDPAHTHVEGPYTSRHRSHRGSLWTPIIQGEEIVVEVFTPTSVAQPVIEIRKVNQGYQGFEKVGILGGNADDCNIDVMCPAGNNWPKQIRAVGAYTIEGKNICTGTMLNNTKGDRTPYFLSANHCGVNTGNDDTVEVYWNYQKINPTCNTNQFSHGPGILTDNQSGSLFRASYAPSDFLLLELSQKPDSGFNVFYAGWDTKGTGSFSPVGIHHPWLEVKAISSSTTSPTTTMYNSSSSDPLGNHWRVVWNSGVTEKGSSGSCLFDTNGRCIGQLHGGNPLACQAPNSPDWYGKFSVSWAGGGANETRLSDWLGPLPAGVTGIDGDPHITTTNGVHYDFQAAGEFVALRDPNGLEIQTRQAPVPTSHTITDTHSELPVCVSVNTAVAARVGGHSVSYQPTTSSTPDPNSLELVIDGKPAAVDQNGLDLRGGGRLVKTTVPGGLEFDFPDGSVLFATPNWWNGPDIWYFNVNLTRPFALDGTDANSFPIGGIAGPIASGDWLPQLPDGRSMGPRPSGLQERYVDLYQKFADAWRVTNESSLFKYPDGTSTENFTLRSWPPPLNSPCTIPQGQVHGAPTHVPVKPVKPQTVMKACLGITDKHARQNCIFDVQVTGNLGFAKTYRLSERVVAKSTRTTVSYDKVRLGIKELAAFTATVAQARAAGKDIPTGSVQFMVDGRKVGKPQPLDRNGQAIWKAPHVQIDKQEVTARYIPNQKSKLLPSMSALKEHTVGRD